MTDWLKGNIAPHTVS